MRGSSRGLYITISTSTSLLPLTILFFSSIPSTCVLKLQTPRPHPRSLESEFVLQDVQVVHTFIKVWEKPRLEQVCRCWYAPRILSKGRKLRFPVQFPWLSVSLTSLNPFLSIYETVQSWASFISDETPWENPVKLTINHWIIPVFWLLFVLFLFQFSPVHVVSYIVCLL